MDPSLARLLATLADNFETTAAAIREFVGETTPNGEPEASADIPAEATAVERARALHRHLGPRQEEIISLIEEMGPDGADTGSLSRHMKYDQPNIYLTLQGLIRRGLIERDTSQHPHRYYLSPLLLGE